MNSLEFIEKEIKRYKTIIIGIKAMLKEPKTEDVIKFLKNDLKEYEEKVEEQSMTNIYEKVKIIYDEKLKMFGVMNIVDIQSWFTIATTSDLKVAEQIKKAYCDGYYDGYHKKEK